MRRTSRTAVSTRANRRETERLRSAAAEEEDEEEIDGTWRRWIGGEELEGRRVCWEGGRREVWGKTRGRGERTLRGRGQEGRRRRLREEVCGCYGGLGEACAVEMGRGTCQMTKRPTELIIVAHSLTAERGISPNLLLSLF